MSDQAKRIKNYTIVVGAPVEEPRGEQVKAYFADKVIDEVNEKLREGWQPWGPPFEAGKDGTWLLQAMVKYEE